MAVIQSYLISIPCSFSNGIDYEGACRRNGLKKISVAIALVQNSKGGDIISCHFQTIWMDFLSDRTCCHSSCVLTGAGRRWWYYLLSFAYYLNGLLERSHLLSQLLCPHRRRSEEVILSLVISIVSEWTSWAIAPVVTALVFSPQVEGGDIISCHFHTLWMDFMSDRTRYKCTCLHRRSKVVIIISSHFHTLGMDFLIDRTFCHSFRHHTHVLNYFYALMYMPRHVTTYCNFCW